MDRARTRRSWSVPADRSGVPARVVPHDISPRRTVTALRSHGPSRRSIAGPYARSAGKSHPFWTYAPAQNFNATEGNASPTHVKSRPPPPPDPVVPVPPDRRRTQTRDLVTSRGPDRPPARRLV